MPAGTPSRTHYPIRCTDWIYGVVGIAYVSNNHRFKRENRPKKEKNAEGSDSGEFPFRFCVPSMVVSLNQRRRGGY